MLRTSVSVMIIFRGRLTDRSRQPITSARHVPGPPDCEQSVSWFACVVLLSLLATFRTVLWAKYSV